MHSFEVKYTPYELVHGSRPIPPRQRTQHSHANVFYDTCMCICTGLRFLMDVSSSMSRFNGSDRRLDRMCASTVMIMEAFQGPLCTICLML